MAIRLQHARAALSYAPQWWMWIVSGLAWLSMIAAEAATRGWLGGGMAEPGFQAICYAPRQAAAGLWARAPEVAAWSAGWLFMVAAMMFPLLTEPVRTVAFASPRRRRHRSIVFFLIGYTLLWSGFGLALAAALQVVAIGKTASSLPIAAACGFALAAAWVWMPARRLALVACGRTMPLRTLGWRADLDCLHYGVVMGKTCVRTCWAPMAALMLAHHGLAEMALVALLLAYERYFLHHKSKLTGYFWGAAALWSLAVAMQA
jgi:hypothetical protein